MQSYNAKVTQIKHHIAKHTIDGECLHDVVDILHGSAMELAFDDLKKGEITPRKLGTAKKVYAIRLASDTGLIGYF